MNTGTSSSIKPFRRWPCSISRIYPNIQLSDADLEYFANRVPLALREAKVTIDEIY